MAVISRFAIAAVTILTGHMIAFGQDDAAQKSLKELQGTYSVMVMEAGGKKAPEAFLKQLKYGVKDNKLVANIGMGKKEDPITIKLDPSKKPAHIDFEESQLGGKVRKSYGIYKFVKGELTICATDSDKLDDRPKVFKAEKPKQFLIVLKRDVQVKK